MKSTHDILGGIPLPTCPFNNTALPSLETEYPFHILNPSTALFYLFFSFIYLSLAVAVWTKLSSLKIFNRKIKDYSILNRMLGIYFLLQSLAVFIDAIRYALNLPFDSVKKKRPVGAVDSQIIDNWLLLSTTLLRSTSILFLCFWLNNSRIYKSAAYGLKIFSKPDEENPVTRHLYVPTQNSTISGIFLPRRNVTRTDTPEEQEELLENDTQVEEIPMHKVILEIIVKIFYTLEFGFVLLFLFRDPPINKEDTLRWPPVFEVPSSHVYSEGYVSLSIFASILQSLPILILGLYIIREKRQIFVATSQNYSTERVVGPSLKAKFILLVSLSLLCFQFLDPSIMSKFVTYKVNRGNSSISFESRMCSVPPFWWHNATVIEDKLSYYDPVLHGWASWVDLTQILGFLGSCLMFHYGRLEFRRNKEEWIRVVVTRVQETFDFRRY